MVELLRRTCERDKLLAWAQAWAGEQWAWMQMKLDVGLDLKMRKAAWTRMHLGWALDLTGRARMDLDGLGLAGRASGLNSQIWAPYGRKHGLGLACWMLGTHGWTAWLDGDAWIWLDYWLDVRMDLDKADGLAWLGHGCGWNMAGSTSAIYLFFVQVTKNFVHPIKDIADGTSLEFNLLFFSSTMGL